MLYATDAGAAAIRTKRAARTQMLVSFILLWEEKVNMFVDVDGAYVGFFLWAIVGFKKVKRWKKQKRQKASSVVSSPLQPYPQWIDHLVIKKK